MAGVVCALVATFATLGAAGLLIQHAWVQWRLHLGAWSVGLSSLAFALATMTWGFSAGYGASLFRMMELFGALIAPLALALGLVELTARYVQMRFVARLVIGTYALVAGVIVVLDPVTGKFGSGFPKPNDHYTVLPQSLLAVGHVLTVIIVIAATASVAMRVRRAEPEALEVLLPVAIVSLADVFVVVAARAYLPGPLSALMLGAAGVGVWFGAVRASALLAPPVRNDEPAPPVRHMQPPPVRRDEPVSPAPVTHAQPPVKVKEPEPMPMPSDPGARYLSDLVGPIGGGAGSQSPPAPPTQPGPAVPPVSFAPAVMFGLITVYVLHEGREGEFDRLANETIEAVRMSEPDTIIYTSHTVANSPSQRLCYQLFRDRAAFESHERQPHTQRFLTEVRPHVASINVIELNLGAAKVAALPSLNNPASRPGGY